MTDYVQDIENGTMMIRDVGNGWVEFWFRTGPSTWNNDQTWHAFFDNAWHDYEYSLATGGNWQKFGSTFLTTRQNVTFRIDGSGLGWPTSDLVAFVERVRVPDPPKAPYFGERETGRIHVAFDYNYDGGGAIDDAEIWYSYDGTPRYVVQHTRDAWVSGLSPKTRYFFWGKVHNFVGWSSLGARSEARTLGVPDAPKPPSVVAINPTSAKGSHRTPDPGNGGSAILEFQTGYGKDSSTPQAFISGKVIDLTNLDPAQKYYFWARARNAIGWGPWSIRTDVQLPAGAWVNVGGIWKRALPWENVGGVWKILRPNIPVNGTWKVPSS